MKIYFISLGCDKNKVDSEKILDFFIRKFNAKITYEIGKADVCFINSCAFISDAKKETIGCIKEICEKKKKNAKVVLLGCLAKEYKINKNFTHIDLDKYVDEIMPVDKYLNELNELTNRINDVRFFSKSIKISDGCNKNCTYCIIPKLRGKFTSNTFDNIYMEAINLAKSGAVELNIVGQDVLNYGVDIYKKNKIVDLLNLLSEIKGIKWIRLLYCYPEEITDDLISLIKNNKKILHYIDMPIQHIDNDILKSMNRATNEINIREKIKKLRSEINDIIIRTTFMVGFPNETDKKFNKLLDFISDMKFDKVGCFKYSREVLSDSYYFENQIDEETKEFRKKQLLDLQKEIVISKNESKINKVYDVLIEGYDREKKCYIGRNYENAYDIDDLIYIKSKKQLLSGSFKKIKITNFNDYDLIGEIYEN